MLSGLMPPIFPSASMWRPPTDSSPSDALATAPLPAGCNIVILPCSDALAANWPPALAGARRPGLSFRLPPSGALVLTHSAFQPSLQRLATAFMRDAALPARGAKVLYLDVTGQDLSDRALSDLLVALPALETLRCGGTHFGGFTAMMLGSGAPMAAFVARPLPSLGGGDALSTCFHPKPVCAALRELDLSSCRELRVGCLF